VRRRRRDDAPRLAVPDEAKRREMEALLREPPG